MSRSHNPATQRLEQITNEFGTGPKYRTCPVSIPDASSICGFCRQQPDLLRLIPSCSQVAGTHWQHAHKLKQHNKMTNTKSKERSRHRTCFYWSSNSVESYSPLRGLWATQRRLALEDHEGHPSRSLFQLLFLFLLDDSFPCGGGIEPVQTSRGTPQALGCSPATPSHLGPKSPRVTNANHEIDKNAQVLKGGLLLIWISLNPQDGFCNLDQSPTKKGLESVLKVQKRIRVSAESAASKGGG
jgi:hypothetical protein